MNELPDVQQNKDGFYSKSIEKVGVRGIKVPLHIMPREDYAVKLAASISSYCNLDEKTKGINMSRIARSINEVNERKLGPLTSLKAYLEELQVAHNVSDVYVKATFDYMIKKTSPITELVSWEPVKVALSSVLKEGIERHYLRVESTEMSLCPCSKEMSLLINNISNDERKEIGGLSKDLRSKILRAGFGAHNQKSIIDVTVELADEVLYIEDVYALIQKSASAPTFAVLKRPDEKYLTEISYMGGYYSDGVFIDVPDTGPKFVEDISRDAARQLDACIQNGTINDYVVVVNNQESIHSDNIVATSILSAGKDLK